MKLVLAAACALSLAACSAGTATTGELPVPAPTTTVTVTSAGQAGAVNPVGAFEFNTMVNGQPMTGTVEVAGSPGAYTGRVMTSITPDLPIRSVQADGQNMTVVADTPDGPVTIRMTFTGDTFTGNWMLGNGGGDLSGRRTR